MGKRRRKGWMCTMNFCLRQLGTLEFWETLLDSFGNLGPIAPIMLAMVESFFPPLPLIAIVALNVAAHGGILGFLYSWAGVALGGSIMFLFWRREDGLHHCQKDRCHRPQPLKAVQQCLPEFQRTQLMYPIDEHRSHRARTLPFASDHY